MIAIVIVNWNGWRDTIGCIQSCLALTAPPFRIVVCDNASADGSIDKIANWARGAVEHEPDPSSPVKISSPRLPRGVALLDRTQAEAGTDGDGAELLLVQTGQNLGFAGGNNVGLRWALARGASHVWMLNNDTVVPTDALQSLVETIETDPKLGLVGSVLVDFADPQRLQAYGGAIDMATFRGRHLGAGKYSNAIASAMRNDPPRQNEIFYPVGASMLASATFLHQIGLMEESYFLYYEEADWVLRARDRFKIAVAPDSLVYHKEGASAGSLKQGISASTAAFLYRSRLQIGRRFAKKPRIGLWRGIADDLLRAIFRGRAGQARGILRAISGKVKVPNQL